MLKKSLLILIAGFVLIFAGAQNKVEARDVFVGTSNTTGWDCYAVTESFRRYEGNMAYGGETAYTYTATLKMVTRSGNTQYLDYTFHVGNFPMWFENSQGYSGRATQNGTPIEWNLFQVLASYYRD